MSKRLLVLVLAVALAPATALAEPDPAVLARELDAALGDPRLDGAQVGLVVRSATTGEVLYTRGGSTRLVPGSNVKLLTSTAALAILGPTYRFRTSVHAETAARDGVLAGNLYLRGTGDPSLQASRYAELASQLARSGLKEVRGQLVADDTWFDSVRLGNDWAWDDEPFAYAAEISALTVAADADFNIGSVMVEVSPGGGNGAPVRVELRPTTRVVKIENTATTTPAGSARRVSIRREHGSDTIRVTGSLPVDERPARVLQSVRDPTDYAADVFRSALAQEGIQVRGTTARESTPPGLAELAALESMSLDELDIPFLKLSNNGIAEILVKSMGRKVYGEGSWAAGLRAIDQFLVARGVRTDTLQLRDGSGLSPVNLVPPKELSQLLFSVQGEEWFGAWYDALPVACAPEPRIGGTLSTRMCGTPAEGNVHAKTGTLTSGSALSGYVTTAAGDPLIFSIVLNNVVGPAPKSVEDAVAEALAASGASSGAARYQPPSASMSGTRVVGW